MATKKKATFSKALLNLLIVVPTLFSMINKAIMLIGLEARLAGRSIITIIIFTFVFGISLTSTWLCILAMLYNYFLSLHWSWQLAGSLIILLNLLLMIVSAIILSKSKNNLTFPVTRKHFLHSHSDEEDC